VDAAGGRAAADCVATLATRGAAGTCIWNLQRGQPTVASACSSAACKTIWHFGHEKRIIITFPNNYGLGFEPLSDVMPWRSAVGRHLLAELDLIGLHVAAL